MKKIFNCPLTRKQICDKFRRLNYDIPIKMSTLESLKFDNLALKKLPIDTVAENYVRTVSGACFSKVRPTPLDNPTLIAISSNALNLLDLSESEYNRKEFVEYFSGNKLLPGSEPAAHCYCGHQFGYFSGQLGDGAAIYLGEVINKKNERWEIQLKGAGLTPYSRTADGRKVLRSSIREFLCSEAIHFLGIPTSRAGTCITSDSKVIRDIFYDGHNRPEKCSVVLRIAPTFIRFGSFEIFKTLDPSTGRYGPSVGRVDILHTLLNYVIDSFYPEITENSKDQVEKYLSFFKQVVLLTARLVVQWQSVGFCHGVLNTDNMSIVGLTIDYGPFGFLNMFNPNHICNASDNGGRYSFTKQPSICLWNLKKFAEAIHQALPLEKSLPLLEFFQTEYEIEFLKKMRKKLGLLTENTAGDRELIQELFDTMENTGADFTNTFLCFSFFEVNALVPSSEIVLENLLEQCYSLQAMIDTYNPNINAAQLQTFLAIANSNPEFINQLGRSGLAIQRVLLQLEKFESLKEMTEETKRENDKMLWSKWLKKYQLRIDSDIESYKGDIETYSEDRRTTLNNNNPRFILRNHILQEAIDMAEKGDFSQVQKLLNIIEKPYESPNYTSAINECIQEEKSKGKTETASCEKYFKAPDWSFSIKVT